MIIKSEERGTYFFVQIKGGFIARHILTARKTIEQAIEIGHTRIVLDLSEVEFLDSMGIGLMVNLNKRLKENSGRFIVINPSDVAWDIIEVSGTENYVQIIRNVVISDIEALLN